MRGQNCPPVNLHFAANVLNDAVAQEDLSLHFFDHVVAHGYAEEAIDLALAHFLV